MAALRQTHCQQSVAFCILFLLFTYKCLCIFHCTYPLSCSLFSFTLFEPLNLVSKSIFLRDTYPLRDIFCTYWSGLVSNMTFASHYNNQFVYHSLLDFCLVYLYTARETAMLQLSFDNCIAP